MALSDVNRRLGRSPIEEIFCFTTKEFGGLVSLDQPWSPWIADDQVEAAIARGATATIMDHVLGLAIAAHHPESPPSTTIDLRIDWARPLTPGAGVSVIVQQVARDGDICLARGIMLQGDDKTPCATGVGRFFSGIFPGRSSMRDNDEEAAIELPASTPCLSAFLGMESLQDGRFVVQGAMRLAGMVRVGAFHGGLVAAASDEAAQRMLRGWIGTGEARCVTLEIEYLRAALAKDALLVEARIVRAGRRTALVEVTTRQKRWDSPVLTIATMLWVKEFGETA